MTTALVFAYHDVGVRCLQVLLAHRVRIPLVVTHEDSPAENIWFGSVAVLARSHGIPVTTPENPNGSGLVLAAADQRPEFVFSFYYRHLLGRTLLDSARIAALNMHGSLLPKYRGRAPVNWAVINGEKRTGVTLHHMTARADAGDIVDQEAVPIGEDDTALDVFRKITSAAGTVLYRNLDGLVRGTAPRRMQDEAAASYFGRRTPEDGRIDWSRPAARIHDLVRGVAPPYPGALSAIAGHEARILRTRAEPLAAGPLAGPGLFFRDSGCFAQCGDTRVLRIESMEWRGRILSHHQIAEALGIAPVPLIPTATETP